MPRARRVAREMSLRSAPRTGAQGCAAAKKAAITRGITDLTSYQRRPPTALGLLPREPDDVARHDDRVMRHDSPVMRHDDQVMRHDDRVMRHDSPVMRHDFLSCGMTSCTQKRTQLRLSA